MVKLSKVNLILQLIFCWPKAANARSMFSRLKVIQSSNRNPGRKEKVGEYKSKDTIIYTFTDEQWTIFTLRSNGKRSTSVLEKSSFMCWSRCYPLKSDSKVLLNYEHVVRHTDLAGNVYKYLLCKQHHRSKSRSRCRILSSTRSRFEIVVATRPTSCSTAACTQIETNRCLENFKF